MGNPITQDEIERMAKDLSARIPNDPTPGALERLVREILRDQWNDLEFDRLKRLTKIGIALSAQPNIDRLFEMIVDEARSLTHADGGTLYVVSEDGRYLRFAIVQNASLDIRMGGTGGEITWPPVALYGEDGQPNVQNVSAYVATSGRIVNIDDVYEADGFDFQGTRRFDLKTGYRSRSMMVVPMHDHENNAIGVLQLLNARDTETGDVIRFSGESETITEALASQAAVALTNRRLIQNLQDLLHAFITAIATAIDEKSPYTGGHVRRVAEIVMELAERINRTAEGPFANTRFSADQMEELRMAAWLHDIGKITTPEHIVDKATRLQAIVDRIDLIRMRAELTAKDHVIETLSKRLADRTSSPGAPPIAVDGSFLEALAADVDAVARINEGETGDGPDRHRRLERIAERTWTGLDGRSHPWITPDEMTNLLIPHGTLTEEERSVVNQHALLTERILSSLPFPKKLMNVPEFAAAHHEKMNGRGYPHGKNRDDLALQSRIIAVADVFEALTAADRPYKKGKTPVEALEILNAMAQSGDLDADVVRVLSEIISCPTGSLQPAVRD